MAYLAKSYYQDRGYKGARSCSYLRNDDKESQGRDNRRRQDRHPRASSLSAMAEQTPRETRDHFLAVFGQVAPCTGSGTDHCCRIAASRRPFR